VRVLALCCTTLTITGWPGAALAEAHAGLDISVGEPAGFSDLTEKHELIVDVFYGGVRRGEARIVASPESLRIVDTRALVALLPQLSDPYAVERALTASVAANAGLACSRTSDPKTCGRLEPAIAGVILDRDHFRLDVFVNPRFLAVHDNVEDRYLPQPVRGLALINAIGAVVSGRVGHGAKYYNLQDQVVLGSGEGRVRADLTYASGLGFGAERLAFELDKPGLRYSAGALWTPGNDMGGRRKLIGAGIETQIDTRLDKDEILGSPVVVFLDQRARIDVVRDGRVLASRIYEAGNQQVDTSNLPEGSYAIVLRIDEPGRPVREERRFFTKSRRIPSEGRTNFFAFAGLQVAGGRGDSLRVSDHPYAAGGFVRRLSHSWAVEGSFDAGSDGASAELAATLLTPLAQVRAAVVADLDGATGGIIQVASVGSSRLNFNFDARRIVGGSEKPDADLAAGPVPAESFGSAAFDDPGLSGSYSQLGGIVSYSLADVRFLGSIFYRDDDDAQRARYSIGPAVEWDVLRKGPFVLTMRGDVTQTEHGHSGFAGLSLRIFSGAASATGLAGSRVSNKAGDALGQGIVAAVSGAWNPSVAGGQLALGVGYEHQPLQDNVVVSSEFNHRLGSVAVDLTRTDGIGSSVSQFSAGLQTTFAVGAGELQFAGKTTTDSLVVARVDGAGADDVFDVLVNEQVAGRMSGSGPLTLALPGYHAYAVRIRPTGKNLLGYDSSPRLVSLYPGNVARLVWAVTHVKIMYGRLIRRDGTPLAGASLTTRGAWGETDDHGYFQIEAAAGAELTVTTADGRSFNTALPPGKDERGITRLGLVTCCDANAIRLGADDPARRSGDDTGGEDGKQIAFAQSAEAAPH
jgi:hypothetical protein